MLGLPCCFLSVFSRSLFEFWLFIFIPRVGSKQKSPPRVKPIPRGEASILRGAPGPPKVFTTSLSVVLWRLSPRGPAV
jgi:hypothetical protein